MGCSLNGKHSRIPLIVALAVTGLLVLGVGALALLLPAQVAGQQLSRVVPSSVMFGRQPIPVAVSLDLASFADCQSGSVPLDAVLVVDQSGSMAGAPFVQAAAGASRFAELVTATPGQQVALVLFNEHIVQQSGLGTSAAQVKELLSQTQASDGTDIALALQAAREELRSMRRRANANAAVVLFTDGGSEPAAALKAASQLKDAGVQIFVIGLRGEDFDEPLLGQIASNAQTIRLTPTADELIALFEDAAQAVSANVLTAVKYFEPLNQADLEIVPGSTPADTDIIADGLLWHIEALTKDQVNRMSEFSYKVLPRRFGFLRTTNDMASLTLTPCGRQKVESVLPPGPTLLVLPPLWSVLLFPLLLLLGGLMLTAGLFGRFKSPKVPAAPPTPPRSPQTPGQPAGPDVSKPEPSGVAAWLGRAERWDPEGGRTPGSKLISQPTLIVGLGATGRTVLGQIAGNLTERFGARWPSAIRLLQINGPTEGKAVSPIPGVAEATLSRSPSRLNYRLPHLAWAKPHEGSKRSRGFGRMALFADLADGKGSSQLWSPMGEAIANCTNLRVWIVADAFSSDGSGLTVDIAHLIRRRVPSGVIDGVRLCLAMQNAHWPGQGAGGQLASRTMATLREIRRMRQETRTHFTYVPNAQQSELDADCAGKLFDDVYCFDGKGEEADGSTPFDISSLPAEEGVLRVISNALLALLEPTLAQRFYEDEKNTQSALLRQSKSGLAADLEEYGSVMGCATLIAPIEPSRRLMELRLVHQTLFHPEEGLWGWERLDEHGRAIEAGHVQVPGAARDLQDFWEHARFTSATLSQVGEPDRLRALTGYLEARMNASAPLRLRWALGFVNRLEAAAPDFGASLQGVKKQLQTWVEAVGTVKGAPEGSSQSGPSANVAKGSRLLNLSLGDAPSASASRGIPEEVAPGGPLVRQWHEHWKTARAAFPPVRPDGLAPERPAWGMDDEYEIFQRHFGDGQDTVLRLRQRIYWLWSLQGRAAALRLLVLPGDLNAPAREKGFHTILDEIQANPYAVALPAERATEALDALLEAAVPLSRGLSRIGLSEALRNEQNRKFVMRNSSVLATMKVIGEASGDIKPQAYLLLPPDVEADIKATAAFTGTDPARCSMLRVCHVIRLSSLQGVREAAAAYYPEPELFLFEPEQAAAQREKIGRQILGTAGQDASFSAQAVTLLLSREHEANVLGGLLAHGLIWPENIGGDWVCRADDPSLMALAGRPMVEVLSSFLRATDADKDLLAALQQKVVEQTQLHAASLVAWNDRIHTEVLEPLAGSADGRLVDLALLCASALQKFTEVA